MDKIKIWLIPGLIVVLALVGLVYFRGKLPEEQVKEPVVAIKEEPVEEKTKPKGFAKPVEPSTQKKAESDAGAMADALNSGNFSDCANITWNEEMRQQCEDNLNYTLIIKSGNESECEELYNEALKIQCYDKIYMSAAVDQKDPAICEKITDATLKKMCLDQVQMMLTRYATSADDCSSIVSDVLRSQCKDNYYLKSSAKELNVDGCDNISDPNLADQCRTTVVRNIEVMEQSKKAAENAAVVKSLQEILVLCGSLSGDKVVMCKDAVYPQLAFDEKDLSYCDKISDELKISECAKEQGDKINTYYLRQSLASRDKSVCEMILDDELKQLCQSS